MTPASPPPALPPTQAGAPWPSPLAALAVAAAAIARQAGAAIEAIRQQPAASHALADKADGTPLSRADLAAHRVIVPALQALTPAWPVVSEEDAGGARADPPGELFWLVDPLDGTKEFLAGNGEYTVNIALVRAGEPVLGVVQMPAQDLLYVGATGLGAWRERAGGAREALRVALPPAAGEPWRVLASRHHRDAATQAFIDALGHAECLSVGSSLKFCRIAEGAAHLYPRLGPTHEWDTAAAHSVLVAAGGCVSTPDGLPLRYGRPGVPNPAFFAGCVPLDRLPRAPG